MNKAISTSIVAVAALALSGGAYAQSNNTLATPTTVSPAAHATSGYGTPGAGGSDSGTGTKSQNPRQQENTDNSSVPGTGAFGSHNTLATPTTASPANSSN